MQFINTLWNHIPQLMTISSDDPQCRWFGLCTDEILSKIWFKVWGSIWLTIEMWLYLWLTSKTHNHHCWPNFFKRIHTWNAIWSEIKRASPFDLQWSLTFSFYNLISMTTSPSALCLWNVGTHALEFPYRCAHGKRRAPCFRPRFGYKWEIGCLNCCPLTECEQLKVVIFILPNFPQTGQPTAAMSWHVLPFDNSELLCSWTAWTNLDHAVQPPEKETWWSRQVAYSATCSWRARRTLAWTAGYTNGFKKHPTARRFFPNFNECSRGARSILRNITIFMTEHEPNPKGVIYFQ